MSEDSDTLTPPPGSPGPDASRPTSRRPAVPGSAAVIGMGLIGGSIARDLAASGCRVSAADTAPASLGAAQASGVAEPFDLFEGPDRPVELVVVAVPVREAPGVLRRVREWVASDAVVTDVGSTKRSVLEAALAAGLGDHFVGSHPMAGHHRSGWDASRRGLFLGARVWICPTGRADSGATERVMAFWRELGADTRTTDAAAHDRLMAWASHLPQMVASALAATLDGAGVDRTALGPGGRDSTRLAASDPGLWRDILLDNRDEVDEAASALIAELTVFRRAVAEGDEATLRALLEAGQTWSRGAPPDATS